MKRTYLVIAALMAVLLVVACGTSSGGSSDKSGAKTERKVNSKVPEFVRAALKSTPEDALVGVGTAKFATVSMSRTAASTRARADISRQMNSMIRDMVRDYTAASEVDQSAIVSFTENITTALSESKLTGATIVDEDMDDEGNYWVVVMLSKTSTVAEINQAQAAAKLAVPAMLSFNAEDRMNEAFAKITSEEVVVVDR